MSTLNDIRTKLPKINFDLGKGRTGKDLIKCGKCKDKPRKIETRVRRITDDNKK